ncbi:MULTISPECIES: hypothetical protein [unclassified Acinetobacter]|uniref:hypothetical protein n=1 Tax=unclassified Acinetobacter TaxID=196816 RepID=UPI003A8AFA61
MDIPKGAEAGEERIRPDKVAKTLNQNSIKCKTSTLRLIHQVKKSTDKKKIPQYIDI